MNIQLHLPKYGVNAVHTTRSAVCGGATVMVPAPGCDCPERPGAPRSVQLIKPGGLFFEVGFGKAPGRRLVCIKCL